MLRSIVLREKLLTLAYRWYWVVVLFLFGSLVGGIVARILPTNYQATLELYVGLDPYQTQNDRNVAEYAHFEFTNPDDYKHWQMSQLSLLVEFDDVLQETLRRLRALDSYWNGVDIADLRNSVQVYWRNAGKWNLVAEANNPEHASQLVLIWREVIIEKMGEAVAQSRRLLWLDRRLSVIEEQRLAFKLRVNKLSKIEAALGSWQANILAGSDSTSMDIVTYWRLWSLVAQAADYQAGWQSLLERIPAPLAPIEEFVGWIEAVQTMIRADLASIQEEIGALDAEREKLLVEWEQTLPNGRGLSAALVIEQPSDTAPQIEAIRPTTLMLLVGGFASLIIGSLIVLAFWARGEK